MAIIKFGNCIIQASSRVNVGPGPLVGKPGLSNIISTSVVAPGAGFKVPRGFAAVDIRSRSGFDFNAATITDATIYDITVTPLVTWIVTPSGNYDYFVDTVRGITSIYHILPGVGGVHIGATSLFVPDTRTSYPQATYVGSKASIRATAKLLSSPPDNAILLYGNSTLLLSNNERGEAYATIEPAKWSSIKGVRPGFKILVTTPEEIIPSLALVDADPQYEDFTIKIKIVNRFEKKFYNPGEWTLAIPDGTNFNDQIYTPSYFRQSDLLSVYMEDFRNLVVSESEYLSNRTRDFRKWDKIDREFLAPMAQTMGMNIRLDRFDSEQKRRAIHEWISFCQYAGIKEFIDFEGYIIDTVFTIDHLWTNDYKNFLSKAEENALNPGSITYPAFYPTNHVTVGYDPSLYDISDPNDIRYIYDMFYTLASVPLVLHYLNGYIKDATQLYVESIGHDMEFMPMESTPLPPNFWIIGASLEFEIITNDINPLPPNFWIVGMSFETEVIMEGNPFNEYALKLDFPEMISKSAVNSRASSFTHAAVSIRSGSGMNYFDPSTPGPL
jgi:hypothetical protein